MFALLFAPLALLMTAVLRVYFRRVRVRLHGSLPARCAALVVSNHPCTWVDAGVLDLALRRRLHFLTEDVLFHPRARVVPWDLRIASGFDRPSRSRARAP